MKLNTDFSLKTIFSFCFVFQVSIASILVFYLSSKSNQVSIDELAVQLTTETNNRISGHIESFFKVPVSINKFNANLISNKLLNPFDKDELTNHFWNQITVYDSVNSIYFGNKYGGLANAGRETTDNSFYKIETENFTRGVFRKYRLDDIGNKTSIVATIPSFDSTTRPWYQGALKSGDVYWSDVYILFTGHDMAISSAYPVYSQNVLYGVVSIDIFLSQISSYLASLTIGTNGYSIIIEQNGDLIASSLDVQLFEKDKNSQKLKRNNLYNLSNLSIIDTKTVDSAFKFMSGTNENDEYKTFVSGKGRQKTYCRLSSLKSNSGLQWYVITVIPESDFMHHVYTANRKAFAMIVVIIFISIIFALGIAHFVTKPLIQLNKSVKKISEGSWDHVFPSGSIKEVNELSIEYNSMKDKLKNMLSDLRDEIHERQLSDEAAHREKEKLAVTLKSIGDGVITTDIYGRIELMNSVAEQLCEWSQDEASGKKLTDVFNIINSKTNKISQNPVEKVLSTGQIVELDNHTVLVSKTGRRISIADSGAPIKNETGEITGVVLVFRDVTEKEKMIETLHRTDKLESLGLLAGGIAHDFNNLLGGIFGYIDIAKYKLNSEDYEAVSQYLDKSFSAFDRAKNLTMQLLTFSKGGEPVKEVVNIIPLIEQSISLALAGSNIVSHFDFNNQNVYSKVDKSQIFQVFDNIIINAKQAMPQGGNINIKVLTDFDRETLPPALDKSLNYVKILFSDTGEGIPVEYHKKIFDPFFSTKQNGNGLGLATCYSVVSKHDGLIELESELNKGTTFILYLPRYKKDVNINDIPVSTQHRGTGKIVVFDDEDFILEIVSKMLSFLGYETLTAKKESELLEILNIISEGGFSNEIRAFFLDLTIPGEKGGKHLVEKISSVVPELPIFAASGYSEDPVIAEPRKYGFTASIKKPFVMEDLIKLLNNFL